VRKHSERFPIAARNENFLRFFSLCEAIGLEILGRAGLPQSFDTTSVGLTHSPHRRASAAICAELPLRGEPDHASPFAIDPAQSRAPLHFGLLRQRQGVLYLDAKVANRALESFVWPNKSRFLVRR